MANKLKYWTGTLWIQIDANNANHAATADSATHADDATTVGGKYIKSGSSTFNSTTGRTIAHTVGNTAFEISITPTANPGGYLGEVWVIKAANTFTVYNSGSSTVGFDWVLTN